MNNIIDLNYNRSWFKLWFDTSFYHQLYAHRDESEAIAFVDALVEKLQPPHDSVMLDLGCGAGRHAKQLARRGYTVMGLDLSASSIRKARQRPVQGTQFYQHDMRRPFGKNWLNYVFSFFTSFGYFQDEEENNAVLKNISESLKDGGILVMDYLNVNYAEDHLVPLETKEIDGVFYNITRWDDERYFFKKIEIRNTADKCIHEFTEKVEKLTLTDFNILFLKSGLHLREVFGDYKLSKYDVDSSQRLIMIVKKQCS